MALILAVYSRKGPIHRADVASLINDFSLDNERRVETRPYQNLLFSYAKAPFEAANIAVDDEGNRIILFGGRIYEYDSNIRKTSRADLRGENTARVVLDLYEKHGESFLQSVNGIFAFVIYDRRRGTLTVANDSFGRYPLFFYCSKHWFVFCSEYEPITRCPDFEGSLDYNAVAQYFTLGFTLGQNTFFKRIKNVTPGTLLTIRGEGLQQRRYESLEIGIETDGSMDDVAGRVATTFRDAVQARVNVPEQTRMTLTGGADSRFILGNLDEEQRQRMSFFTVRSSYLGGSQDQDVRIARMLARRFQLKHRVVRPDPTKEFSELFYGRARARFTQRKLLITGNFGGEFLGGGVVQHFRTPSMLQLFPRGQQPERLRRGKIKEVLQQLFNRTFVKEVSDICDELEKEVSSSGAENKELLFMMQHYTRSFFTCFNGGTLGGEWATPHRIPTKPQDTPFYDARFLKELLSVPHHYLSQRRLYGQIYQTYHPRLLELPSNRNDGFMSFAGHVPSKKEDRSSYSKALERYLQSQTTWERQCYNEPYLRTIARDENDPLVRAFVDFEAWCRSSLH